MIEDLYWFGLRWQEGPDCGGPVGPYAQSLRRSHHTAAFQRLKEEGLVYPCRCSRGDVQRALQAPHQGEEEPVYPGTCRPREPRMATPAKSTEMEAVSVPGTLRVNWRFRVPDGEAVWFLDGALGRQSFLAGRDFGDFVVWRHDDVPAYQLAVVVDDATMGITEVVRGEDLLLSTARQLLLYRALGLSAPGFYHCPLLLDANGVRLAKRHAALSLRSLRAQGLAPEVIRSGALFAQ
jgi:glutamyl-tRNA synthetase